MVSQFFLDVVFSLVNNFFKLMPDITWNADTSAFAYFISILQVVSYMLPMKSVAAVISIIFGFNVFKIVISFIKTLWDLLPLV